MRQMVPPAKLTAPKVSNVLARTRLFNLIDKARNKQVTYICGPAGSGKTTLVVSYLEARGINYIWYRVDSNDRDIAHFFRNLSVSVKNASPRKRASIPRFSPEHLTSLKLFTQHFFQTVYSRLSSCVIVLDDHQEAPGGAAIHDVIQGALREAPAHVHYILISRDPPPKTLSRLQASSSMSLIDYQDLRLSEKEALEIAVKHEPKLSSKNELRTLCNLVDGWAAGLVMMLEFGLHNLPPANQLGGITSSTIFDYFASEVFEKTDRQNQLFLMHTAFLPGMDARMAAEMSGQERAEQILNAMHRKSLFTEQRILGETLHYQYHPLFRAFLLSRARQAFTDESLRNLQYQAALLLEKYDNIEPAVALLTDAQNWVNAVRMICLHASNLFSEGRFQTLRIWLEAIPESRRVENPWLLYWLGMVKMNTDLIESRKLLQRSYALFKAGQDREKGLLLSWCGIVDTFHYELGSFSPLDHWISEFEEFYKLSSVFPVAELKAHVLASICCALIFRQTHHPDMSAWVEQAYELLQGISNINLRMMLGNQLILYYMWIGDMVKVRLIVQQLQPIGRKSEVPPLVRLMWFSMDAQYAWLTNDTKACESSVQAGLKVALNSGVHDWDFHLLSHGVYGSLTAGNLPAAAQYLRKMEAVLNSGRYLDVSQYHYLAAWEASVRGNVRQALEHANRSLILAQKAGSPYPVAVVKISLAQLLYENGKYAKAARYLADTHRYARKIKSIYLDFVCLMAEAYLALERGFERIGLRLLRKAMASGKQQGYVNFPWCRLSVMTYLCVTALEADIEVDYAQKLVRCRRLTPETPPINIKNWPWQIKIFTLGRFALHVDDKPLQFIGKTQKKPLEMLKVLIGLGGSEVSEAQLSDILWPGADGDMAHQALATTLYRLRKLLGDDRVLRLSDGRLTLDNRLCRVDAWAFEQALDKINKTALKDLEISDQQEKTIHLYKGPFLGDDGADLYWAMSLRERLRIKYIRMVEKLGQFYQQAGKYEKAVEWYLTGLETEDLTEEFYRQLMLCYEKLGNKAEAANIYNRCSRTLSSLLGIEPSQKTRAIYDDLR